MNSPRKLKYQLGKTLLVPFIIAFFFCGNALAAGTEAHQTISNTATISYSVGGVNQDDIDSTAAQFLVDRKVDLTMTDPQSFAAVTPSTQVVWPFTLTNEGNADQGYRLNLQAASGNTFEISSVSIYLDSNNNGAFEDGTDQRYSEMSYDGSTFTETFEGSHLAGDLGNDGAMQLFLVATIPSSAANAQTATYHIIATTVTAGSSGTISDDTQATSDSAVWEAMTEQTVFGDGQGTVDEADPDGKYSTSVTYTISSAHLVVSKESAVTDDGLGLGNSNPKAIPGATVRYHITIENNGAQAAEGVEIGDVLDTSLVTYQGNVAVTDLPEEDGGAASLGHSASESGGTVTITLTDSILAGHSAHVYFDVVIN